MAKRTCITCGVKKVDKDKTPLWSKKDGLYSMLPRILNCEDKYNPHKNELEETSPEIVGTELTVELEIQEKDNWVFYWAAEAGSSLEGDKPEGAAKSYGDESNNGLSKVDKDGKALLTLNCPKLYKEEDTLFPRHVHYTVLTKDKVWSTNIGTLEVMCKVPFKLMKEIQEKRTYMIMNALSKESYDENHIPNSILCHHESLDGLKKQKKTGIIKKLINENLSAFPSVKKFVKDSGNIKEVPIIVYCASEECDASSKLVEHLYSCGFFNVMEYSGGMKEWLQKSNQTKLFEDADSEEDEEEEVIEEDIEEPLEEGETDQLNDDEELIIYDGVEYIHKLDDSEEILTPDDLTVVGIYDGEEIEWINLKEYKNHVKRKNEKGGIGKEQDEEEEAEEEEETDDAKEDEEAENKEEVKEETKDEEEAKEEAGEEAKEEAEEEQDENPVDIETSDEEGDLEETDDFNEVYLQSKTVSDLKNLLDKMHKTVKKNTKKKDMINCLMGCKNVYKGGGNTDSIMYGGGVTQEKFNSNFRGWGFSFSFLN